MASPKPTAVRRPLNAWGGAPPRGRVRFGSGRSNEATRHRRDCGGRPAGADDCDCSSRDEIPRSRTPQTWRMRRSSRNHRPSSCPIPRCFKQSRFPMEEMLVDESTRAPVVDAPYFLQLADGRYAFGYTDTKGRTRPVFSRTKISHSIYWYDDAWHRWERTKEGRDGAAPPSGAAHGAARRRDC